MINGNNEGTDIISKGGDNFMVNNRLRKREREIFDDKVNI